MKESSPIVCFIVIANTSTRLWSELFCVNTGRVSTEARLMFLRCLVIVCRAQLSFVRTTINALAISMIPFRRAEFLLKCFLRKDPDATFQHRQSLLSCHAIPIILFIDVLSKLQQSDPLFTINTRRRVKLHIPQSMLECVPLTNYENYRSLYSTLFSQFLRIIYSNIILLKSP